MQPARESLDHNGVALRRWRAGDAGTAHRLVSESMDHLAPWMAWAANGYTLADAEAFLAQAESDWRSGTAYNYAILAADGAIIGSISLMARIGPGGLEIGYWLHPAHVGHGIVTRAATALIEEAFRIGADHVEIRHDVANQRSGAVPRRLGFVEVERQPAQEPLTVGEQGIDLVWRRTNTTAGSVNSLDREDTDPIN
ncbi:MAG TPA: GNAT family N-acetyltransferase [Micromonosporaceae bacterium]|nr:GNAT family N-acetyltransferase [Micromonosporaceae bacterium]